MTDPVVDPDATTGELTPQDVDDFTGGRLSADDAETQRMLNAALGAARREVGWHVSPVYTNVEMVFDGDGWGQRKLRLPTKKIVQLRSVVDRGNTLTIGTDVVQSASVPGLLVRCHGCWSPHYSDITVTLDHGFTPDEAMDWRQAILSMVDQMAGMAFSGRPDSDLAQKQVDDVVYRFGAEQALPGAAPILEAYSIRFGCA